MTGRVVLVTNLQSFMGLPSARVLRDAGATVFGHDPAFADPAARSAFAAAEPGLQLCAAGAPADLVDEVLAAAGRLDAVVSNDVHPAVRAPLEAVESDDVRAALEALVVWPVALARAAVVPMRRQGGGKLLFVTSAAPLRGLANYTVYATARGATNAFVVSLARELAPANIQVNAVAPNYVESPTYFPPALLADPAARAKILRNIPLGRLGRPEEVARLIAFFVADDCGFVTGHVLPAAGGWA